MLGRHGGHSTIGSRFWITRLILSLLGILKNLSLARIAGSQKIIFQATAFFCLAFPEEPIKFVSCRL